MHLRSGSRLVWSGCCSPSLGGPGGRQAAKASLPHPRPSPHGASAVYPSNSALLLCPLQVAVGRPKCLADPAAEKPSPQPRAWHLGTGRPPCPQCTQRVTATAGRPSPTAYGRTGPRLQVGADGGQAGCAGAAEPWPQESGAAAEGGRTECGWRPAPALTPEDGGFRKCREGVGRAPSPGRARGTREV